MSITNEQIESMFELISGTALRHWLKVRGYKLSAPTNERLFDKLKRSIDDGIISYDNLLEAACDIEESGGKRIFIFEGKSGLNSKPDFETHLQTKKIQLDKQRCLSIKLPKRPNLNYLIWNNTNNDKIEIRAKYSETHTHLAINKERRTFNPKDETKIVVITYCPQSGILQVRFDSAGDLHQHKNEKGISSLTCYYEYYFSEAKKLLGITELKPIDLRPGMERFFTQQDPRIFRLPHHVVRTSFNSILKCHAPSPEADVRDDPAHQGASRVDMQNWVQEELKGHLLSDKNHKVYRDIWMGIHPNGEIWFRRDCLEEEINHAVSKLI